MPLYDYSRWPNFKKEELICKHTKKENPNVGAFTALMDKVQLMRDYLGIPFEVNSAYRSPEHPIEAKKISSGGKAGMHSYAAIDIYVPVDQCYLFTKTAFEFGFTGIGINLKGSQSGRFIHLDLRDNGYNIWSYS